MKKCVYKNISCTVVYAYKKQITANINKLKHMDTME